MKINNVTIGIILCMSSLILLSRNQWPIGLASFVIGIIVMNKRRKR